MIHEQWSMGNRRAIPFSLVLLALISSSAVLLAEDSFFDSAGVKIRYTDQGQGPPVVLIHGYSANADMNWRFPGVLKTLADDYRVITIDNRGHGKSDKPTEADQYGSKMVSDVIGLLDHLKIDQAHFVGYSMGGMITMKLATVAPQRMYSAVIGGMGWMPRGSILPERADEKQERSAALRACARAFPDLGITQEELFAIRIPMIVVIGLEDGLLESRVKPLSASRPDIRVVEIPDANHISCLFRPAFRESIKEFLDQQASLVSP